VDIILQLQILQLPNFIVMNSQFIGRRHLDKKKLDADALLIDPLIQKEEDKNLVASEEDEFHSELPLDACRLQNKHHHRKSL